MRLILRVGSILVLAEGDRPFRPCPVARFNTGWFVAARDGSNALASGNGTRLVLDHHGEAEGIAGFLNRRCEEPSLIEATPAIAAAVFAQGIAFLTVIGLTLLGVW